MMDETTSRKAGSIYVGRPTTITIYLTPMEEEALSEHAKNAKQSVPAFIANLLRQRVRGSKSGEQ
jgi:hypothetical protein